jgi:PadR family transcriptional regulator PadR
MKNVIPNRREEVLLSILVAGELYGRDIRDRYEHRTKESMPIGSLYTTLDRMIEKGFIKERWGESSHERGGNRRKFFKLSASGLRALNAAQRWTAASLGEVSHAIS